MRCAILARRRRRVSASERALLGLIQMPALAIAFAAGPIAGQNFGAGNGERVRETFVKAPPIGTSVMVGFTIPGAVEAHPVARRFPEDPETIASQRCSCAGVAGSRWRKA